MARTVAAGSGGSARATDDVRLEGPWRSGTRTPARGPGDGGEPRRNQQINARMTARSTGHCTTQFSRQARRAENLEKRRSFRSSVEPALREPAAKIITRRNSPRLMSAEFVERIFTMGKRGDWRVNT